MSEYGRGEPIGLFHSFGDDIATFAAGHMHRRGGRATIKTIWLRAADPAITPRLPEGLSDRLSDATWAWLCQTDRMWLGLERRLGDDAREVALELVRHGCGELQTTLGRTINWPPTKWIPHPDLSGQRAEQAALRADARDQDHERALTHAAAVEGRWPGLAGALRGARLRQWLIRVAEDLTTGRSHDGPRAFVQHHTANTKTRDSLVKDILGLGVEPVVLSALGINRSPYLGLGGPAAVIAEGRRLDLTGWPGPVDLRVPNDEDIAIEVLGGAETLVVIENRQAAETVCDTYPDVLVLWYHGQPPDTVLQLITGAAEQVVRTLVCPDADLGGVMIAERIVEALPPRTDWRVLDVGTADQPEGDTFSTDTRTQLDRRAARSDSVGSLARGCLERGHVVEQEAATRATILAAIGAIETSPPAHQTCP